MDRKNVNERWEIMEKVLVAYFSPTGSTAHVAHKIAGATGGDLFEIRPAQPYTAEDLNWHNAQSRSSVEMNDRASRPAIAELPDVSGYDTIFVGFPIWWYTAPHIIWAFAEQAGLSGKTVVTFATSGGSSMGGTTSELSALTPADVNWVDGKVLSAAASDASVASWVESLGL